MAVLVLCYEKCSTCKKALDWLCAQGVSYTVRDIVGEREECVRAEGLARYRIEVLTLLLSRQHLGTA